ncbi:MAG: nucleoside recognition protein [Methanosarcinales archaeon]|nr:nucleoside recognition protein [Methanosarcinales archaeon]
MIDLILRTVDFAIPVLVTIFLGLFFAGFIVEMGAIRRLSYIARPLVTAAHLPAISASSFVVSLGSAVAANAMIARFRKEESLSDREALLCAVMNSIPVYLREIFTYQIPIVIPALGTLVGGLYAMVFMVTALVKVSLVVILGRAYLERREVELDVALPVRASMRSAALRSLHSQSRIFARISILYLAMTFLVFLLTDRGFFEALSILPVARAFGIPAESLVPLTSYVASPILGISLLGPMIHSGTLNAVQAMTVLMLGSMFMLPIFAMRSMVPNYTALFGMRLGLSVVTFSTGISILVRLAALLVLLRMGSGVGLLAQVGAYINHL